MDLNLKQWRKQQQQESDQLQEDSAPTLLLDPNQQYPHAASPSLPLFMSEPPTTTKLTHLSADSTVTATKSLKMGSYFSLSQWQELELQALIFRHMLAGAPVPSELLHLLNKSLLNITHHLPNSLHHYSHYYQYQPVLLQSGYWGRAGMDPEPGRCRRTDGKKWRCSRDVEAGLKYCERHMHRGRNRSRKPVEIPTPTTTLPGVAASGHGGGCGGGVLKTNNPIFAQPFTAMPGGDNFGLSSSSSSADLLHSHQRSLESRTENKGLLGPQTVSKEAESDGRILRHFFDDWPRSLKQANNAGSNGGTVTTATNLSISTLGNDSSDFSLKLSTGCNGEEPGRPGEGNVEGERTRISSATAWGTNQLVAPPMGGPLAEALGSSTSNSSPTSVLHRLPPGSTSETSYAST